MALFRSGSSSSAPAMSKVRTPAPVNPAEQHNIIGASTVVEGTVRSKGNVNVSGTVTGNVEVEGRTMVMAGGTVEGEVVTTTAEIAGAVRGQVTCKERLVLKATAVVDGDIRTQKLVVEDGATFNGRCEMGPAADAARQRDRPAGAAALAPPAAAA